MMKTEHRWLKSAIQSAAREEILLPWAAKHTAKPAPTAPAVIYLGRPAPAALHYAIAAR